MVRQLIAYHHTFANVQKNVQRKSVKNHLTEHGYFLGFVMLIKNELI